MNESALAAILGDPVDWSFKGFPTRDGVTVGTLGEQKWNLFTSGFLPPVVVLRERALEHNLRQMSEYCSQRDILLAPHGKTTMAPQLFQRQLQHGAWGITAATVWQVQAYRAFGVARVLLANECVDAVGLRWLASELAGDPAFAFLCYVDSLDGVGRMSDTLAAFGATRPLHVVVEVGPDDGRTGCRSVGDARQVARAAARSPMLRLVGVAGYEGTIGHDAKPGTVHQIRDFLGLMRATMEEVLADGLLDDAAEEFIVSAGGSAYFDLVVDALAADWDADRPVRLIIRSGGYVTHDNMLYKEVSPFARSESETDPLQPALEVWGQVVSRPEPTLALANFGKRDASFDAGLPEPQQVRRPDGTVRSDGEGLTVFDMNDQHAYLRVPDDHEVAIGDWVGCGISHPCTTFDKWRLIPVVDDHDDVVAGIRTFF